MRRLCGRPAGPVARPPAVAFLAVALALAAPAAAATLEVRDAATGALLERVAVPGAQWCLTWRHSVTGGAVADCFAAAPAGLVLERSYLPDHAAGLGETPGRGRLVGLPGGGYVIEGIGLSLPQGRLALRVGSARVGHRIVAPGRDGAVALDLSARHPRRSVHLIPAAD